MTYSVKRNYITAAIILCVVLMMGCIFAYAKSPEENRLPERNKYFTSIQIQSGDTLHGIAAQYMTYEYSSEAEYIEEVRNINGFLGTTLFAGAYLIVPYYAD